MNTLPPPKFAWCCSLLCLMAIGSLAVADETQEDAPPADKPTKKLFNGKDLTGWKVVDESVYKRHGEVTVVDGEIRLAKGSPGTGISYPGELTKINYEVTLEAKRVAGGDFFCGLTFPIKESYCTLILGGWGGSVTGLSNVDGMSAVDNETSEIFPFKDDQWYKVRLRVTEKQVEAWVDDRVIVRLPLADRDFDIWWEQEPIRPFGVATWYTSAALRNIQFTTLEAVETDEDE